MEQKKKDGWWKRIRYKYRLTLENEDTMQVHWHFRVSKLRAALLLLLVFLIALALCSTLILYTPIRTILPGTVTEDERRYLLDETMRLDSMQRAVERQSQYLEGIRKALSGKDQKDSTPPLDSMRILEHEKLIEQKTPATEKFEHTYEQKHKQ